MHHASCDVALFCEASQFLFLILEASRKSIIKVSMLDTHSIGLMHTHYSNMFVILSLNGSIPTIEVKRVNIFCQRIIFILLMFCALL